MIVLTDAAGKTHQFKYGGIGGSTGISRLPSRFRLPDIPIPKFLSKSGTIVGSGATTDFDGGGWVFQTSDRKLSPEDFEGPTLYFEFSGGVLIAGGVSVLLVGLKEEIVVPFIFNPALFSNLLFGHASALIVAVGVSEGFIDGIGAGMMFGSISYGGLYDD
ncbi:hypothetical protein [Caballeronia sp. NK8]|uniref:hypothetical protein n=1 Tax=Caballeronia sp. NK8 TaxID=140098 RepID=UPI001BD1684E|nr:hypothetical protein [Caballeronia sp. NK8]